MKKLFFLVSLLAISVSSNAQVSEFKEFTRDFEVMPKQFVYGGESFILVQSGESENTIDVYNDEIEKVRSFQVQYPSRTSGSKSLSRKLEVKEVSRDSTQQWNLNNDNDSIFTWEEALDYADRDDYSNQQSGYILWPDSRYDYYQNYHDEIELLYPTSYYRWIPESGYLYRYYISYKGSYTGEWETKSDTKSVYNEHFNLWLHDYDGNSYTDDDFIFTQTLFNTDEKYEYLVPVFGETQEEVSSEYDQDHDGEVDERTYNYVTPVQGFKVVSEDGTVLQSIETEMSSSAYFGIMKINGKVYLYCADKNNRHDCVFYQIDPVSTSIKKVNNVPVSVVARYSIDGRRQAHPRRGVNILRYSDGTAAKVVEK